MDHSKHNLSKGGQSGFTLVEVAISGALVVALMFVAVTTTRVVHTTLSTGEAESGTTDRVREVVAQIKQDLLESSMTPDPVTGVGRVQVENATHGGQRLRIRRVDGAALVAGSMTTVWSPWITWEMDADGAVWRTMDGEAPQVVARGIDSLAFQTNIARGVRVTCRSRDRAPNGRSVAPVQVREAVMPPN
jgi:hypothetical protein